MPFLYAAISSSRFDMAVFCSTALFPASDSLNAITLKGAVDVEPDIDFPAGFSVVFGSSFALGASVARFSSLACTFSVGCSGAFVGCTLSVSAVTPAAARNAFNSVGVTFVSASASSTSSVCRVCSISRVCASKIGMEKSTE